MDDVTHNETQSEAVAAPAETAAAAVEAPAPKAEAS